jgi:AraC-like DNA-binding protein
MNDFITIALSGATLLLAFLVLSNPNNVNLKGNRWFGCFILTVFFTLIEDALKKIGLTIENEYILLLINFSAFVMSPVFFMSVWFYVEPNKKIQLSDLKYFSFTIGLTLINLISIIIQKVNPEILSSNSSADSESEIISILFLLLFSFQLIYFGIASYRKLQKHKKTIMQLASNIEEIDLKWLEMIVKFILVLLVLWAIDINFENSANHFSFLNALLLVGVFAISFYSLKQKEVYSFISTKNIEINEIINDVQITENQIDKKKLVSDEKLEVNKNELTRIMDDEKPFLDSELTLMKLAAKLNSTPHQLSYIINTGFNENFYQFINRYRVEEAKKIILDPKMDHLSFVGIGFEVGFNSKSVFNTMFKKISGFTPSQYKREMTKKSAINQ